MNQQNERRFQKWKFSLRHLLTLTALAALSIAIIIAFRKNETLNQSRAALLSMSRRLELTDEGKLAYAELQQVANDFQTWDVYVPPGRAFELYLGIGEVSEAGIPSQVDRVEIPSGQHQVTLHAVVSLRKGNRFVVYVNGKQVIERTPDPDWMPGGWSQSIGLNFPKGWTEKEQAPIHLTGQRYMSRIDVGAKHYFNGWVENSVTGPGYRLWIDLADQTYDPASPFVGFEDDRRYRAIGLRDGFRYKNNLNAPYEFAFTRWKSLAREPVLRIIPEFIADGQTVLFPSFSSWELSHSADDKDDLQWNSNPQQTDHSVFLHATSRVDQGIHPVVELKWDTNRPNEVGLRLAETLANEQITQLRLRIVGGTEHLWRIAEAGEQKLDSRKKPDRKLTESTAMTIPLESDGETEIQVNWHTNLSLPLQVVQRNRNIPSVCSGLPLYAGLPLNFAARIPGKLSPTVSVTRVDQHPNAPDTPFPGGAVFEEIQIEVQASDDDWIWLEASDRKIIHDEGNAR